MKKKDKKDRILVDLGIPIPPDDKWDSDVYDNMQEEPDYTEHVQPNPNGGDGVIPEINIGDEIGYSKYKEDNE